MNPSIQNAFLGSLVADAVSMPVHWYYDTDRMDEDYGRINGYLAPRNPHPDSILWRSRYEPPNEKGDILHEQAAYWGQRDIHYHQWLGPGENTLNFLLAIQLYRSTVRAGRYDASAWLQTYIERMRTPGWHRDTYVEEVHRAFFTRYAEGRAPEECGIDDRHIGGLASVPALIAALDALDDRLSSGTVIQHMLDHVSLTHRNTHVLEAGRALTRMLADLAENRNLRDVIRVHGASWIGANRLDALAARDDREIVGTTFSPACYMPEAFTASLAIAWKYAEDFTGGVLANARCGGDNCHRAAVVGSLLGAANPIPEYWLKNLASMERLRCDTLEPVFNR